jgi:DNA-binding MarR family transcriptional regulator
MSSHKVIDLPTDYALVLQQVSEDGSDEFTVLSETLNIRRSRLSHIIAALRQKGLILIEKSSVGDAWIRLSSKGNKLVHQIWPEVQYV